VTLPPTVSVAPTEGDLRELWVARASQHTQDSYAGVPLSKFPEDLRTYEHLLWLDAPDTVIEIGTHSGGSALWFRDRLRALASYGRIRREPLVVSVDISQETARHELERAAPDYASSIALVESDVRGPEALAAVRALVPAEARCFVVEDSAHEYDTTFAALMAFAQFVPPSGFFVVEDGCVDIDELRISETWPRGVLPALHDWLRTPEGSQFEVRRDLELYGLSCHPEGFLQRTGAPASSLRSSAP
jgi:cephalosporin hydroxylase